MKLFVYEDVTAIAGTAELASTVPASLLAEGRAMLDAITADAQAIPGLSVITLQNADQFEDCARSADWSLIIAPETAGRLEELASRVLNAGGRLLGPSPTAIRQTTDKLELSRRWSQTGVPTPQTWARGQAPFSEVPRIIKPRDGCGSQATYRSDRSAIPWDGELIEQELVAGTPASVAFLVGPSGATPLLPAEQLIADDGTFQYLGGRLPLAEHLRSLAIDVARRAIAPIPGLLGYIGVDLVVDGTRAWAIEINPRLTTSYVGLRAMTTTNLVAAMIDIASGKQVEIQWRSIVTNFTPDGRTRDEAVEIG